MVQPKNPEDVYIYEGAVANAALRMLGAELGMFTDRKDVRLVTSEYDKMTDAELAEKLKEISQQLLLGPVIEHEGLDEIGGSSSVPPDPRRRSRNL